MALAVMGTQVFLHSSPINHFIATLLLISSMVFSHQQGSRLEEDEESVPWGNSFNNNDSALSKASVGVIPYQNDHHLFVDCPFAEQSEFQAVQRSGVRDD
jgi:hypothetical protein